MNHSNIVKDLLHKLSKNEFLAQDGGNSRNSRNSRNQRYDNKVNGYRNQLNRLYGAGEEENKMTADIIGDIDKLIPISILEQFVNQARQQMDGLIAQKEQLEKDVKALKAEGAKGDDAKNEEIKRLKKELDGVQAEITLLTAKLEKCLETLTVKNEEIDELKKNIKSIREKLDKVVVKTIDNDDPVKTLLNRLKEATALPGAPPTSRASSVHGAPPTPPPKSQSQSSE